MAVILTLLSNKNESGNTTIAFNIAHIIKNRQKRVLLVNLGFNQSYFKTLKIRSADLKTAEIAPPFSYVNYDKKLQIMFLTDNPSKTYVLDQKKCEILLTKQIKEWEKLFDYIIFDTDHNYHSVNEIAIKLSNKIIPIFNATNFATTDILNTLKIIRVAQLDNSRLEITNVILNQYSSKETKHINVLLELKRVFDKPNFMVTLPSVKELEKPSPASLEYSSRNQWSDYTIELSGMIKNWYNHLHLSKKE